MPADKVGGFNLTLSAFNLQSAWLSLRAGDAMKGSELRVCESDACVQVIHIHTHACREDLQI